LSWELWSKCPLCYWKTGKRFKDLRDWVELVVGRAQVRSRRNLED